MRRSICLLLNSIDSGAKQSDRICCPLRTWRNTRYHFDPTSQFRGVGVDGFCRDCDSGRRRHQEDRDDQGLVTSPDREGGVDPANKCPLLDGRG